MVGGFAYEVEAPRGGRTRRRSWLQRSVLVLGVLAVMCCLSASAYVGVNSRRIMTLERTETGASLVEVAADQPQNWLVVGSDNRSGVEGNRADAIMIVRVDPEAGQMEILSLQRDLWVPIAGQKGSNRLNAAYAGGAEQLISTIRQDFALDINHYVEIKFESFKAIVDAVGGLPLYFDQSIKDDESGLREVQGCRTLDGDQALAFARSRHLEFRKNGKWTPDWSADYGRISRQQFFMRRMFDRAADRSRSLKGLNDLIAIASDNVTLDEDIDVEEAAEMLKRFGELRGEQIRSYSLPTIETTKGGAAVLLMDMFNAIPILNRFRGLSEKDADPRTVGFSIENGSEVTGQDREVEAAFQAIAYVQAKAQGPARESVEHTVIRHGWGGQDAAFQIRRHLTSGAEVTADPSLDPGQVVLTTGTDFTTVMKRPFPWAPPPVPAAAVEGPSTTAKSATTKKGSSSTAPSTSKSTTTTTSTASATYNDGSHAVGVVPGEPPPGVSCE